MFRIIVVGFSYVAEEEHVTRQSIGAIMSARSYRKMVYTVPSMLSMCESVAQSKFGLKDLTLVLSSSEKLFVKKISIVQGLFVKINSRSSEI